MRKIFLIAGLLAVSGNLALPVAFGQDHSAQTAEGIAAKQELESLKPKLEEYRQGKRDAHDGYVIMFRMLMDYGRLKEGETPEAKALLKEFNLFKERHPEAQKSVSWVVHSGTMSIIKNNPYTSGENARREVAEKQSQDMEEKRKNFVPTDNYIVGIKQEEDRAMVWHQYRIEFYKVPKGTTLGSDNEKLILRRGKQELPLSHVRLIKTMSFVHPLYWDGPIDAFVSAGSKRNFWFCSDPIGGYNANTPEEHAILGEGAGDSTVGHVPYWKNPKGTIESFCGVLDVRGNIIYQLPARYQPHLPGPLIRPGPHSPDGKKLALTVGCAVEDTVDEPILESGDCPQQPKNTMDILIWEYLNTLHTFKDINMYHGNSRKIYKRYGLIK